MDTAFAFSSFGIAIDVIFAFLSEEVLPKIQIFSSTSVKAGHEIVVALVFEQSRYNPFRPPTRANLGNSKTYATE